MQLTKSLTVLAGAAMVALTLAVPVADGPVDAVRYPVLHIVFAADGDLPRWPLRVRLHRLW
jgi:hypothetical protein